MATFDHLGTHTSLDAVNQKYIMFQGYIVIHLILIAQEDM